MDGHVHVKIRIPSGLEAMLGRAMAVILPSERGQ